jgi:hypothetical protein
MEVLNVEEKKDLSIKNLYCLLIMNVMVAPYNGNGQLHMEIYILAVI